MPKSVGGAEANWVVTFIVLTQLTYLC